MRDAAATAHPAARGRRTLLLIALIAFMPVVASTLIYLFFPRPAGTNYGTLLPTRPAPDVAGIALDGTPFRLSALQGKWLLVIAGRGACDERCRAALYATRQARTIQGREQERLVRVWLVTDVDAPPAKVLREHPGLVVARVDPAALASWPGGADLIYLVDPLGNLVLQYPQDPDIKGLAKDLRRLLNASSIG